MISKKIPRPPSPEKIKAALAFYNAGHRCKRYEPIHYGECHIQVTGKKNNGGLSLFGNFDVRRCKDCGEIRCTPILFNGMSAIVNERESADGSK